ncbi:transcription initiation factor TFIID subunit 8-like [Andrographis paniculata]|uniref:transcription initiation factor TFIID subunit 8-like n=1 Tax=Andrographis paniculata TaxID=175694 RepID=UPI0021E96BA9|nr:transcription initiation factor TFIID subunit 8-like [Andrographis paniculata]
MSDGSGKSSAKILNGKGNSESKREQRNEYPQAIAKVAVAQVCKSLGFQVVQQTALETLAEIGTRYITEVGKVAQSSANLANRSECNVFDVIQGLEDLGSIQGFPGSSDVSHSLSLSGVIGDMIRYVFKAEQIPFAHSVPSFTSFLVVKKRKIGTTFARVEEIRYDKHIPHWMPKFSDCKAFLSPGKGNASDVDMVSKIDLSNGHRKNQKNFNGSKEGSVEDWGSSNPFLAKPLPFGVMEVSLPVVPSKLVDEDTEYHRSCEVTENLVLQSEPSANGSDKGNVILNGRPGVHFKFREPKKLAGIEKISLWFGDYEDGID